MYIPEARCNARPVATSLVICVCDWLRDETGLDFGDRSWICNATLMKLLRSQGLPPKQLQPVFTALILSRITYAFSVWGGHLLMFVRLSVCLSETGVYREFVIIR